MKKIWDFMCWQWRKFDTWQRWWFLAMFLLGASFSASDPFRAWLAVGAATIIGLYMIKWVVIDGVRDAWRKYEQEQQDIVDIIKGDK